MKKLLSLALVVFFSAQSFGNITADNEFLLNRNSLGYFKAQLGTLVNQTKNLLVAKYSYAKQGGSTAADISLLTNLNDPKSYAKLPANAIITNVYYNVLTQPTSGGAATLALKAEGANDLVTATAVASATWSAGHRQGIPTGATTTFVKTTAERTIKATFATATGTAGRFDVFIEWVLGSGS